MAGSGAFPLRLWIRFRWQALYLCSFLIRIWLSHTENLFVSSRCVCVCLLGTVRCSFLGVQVSSSEKESFLDCKEEAVLDKCIRTYRQLEHV